MAPLEALDHVYNKKLTEMKNNLTKTFKGVSTKLNVADLLSNVNYPKLSELLINKT